MRKYLHYSVIVLILLISFSTGFAQQNSEALKSAAKSHMDAGRYGEAIDLLNKFISANPRSAEGYSMRGVCFENRAQYQNAVLDLRRAVKLEPNNRSIQSDLDRVISVWHNQLRTKITGHEREIAIDPSIAVNYLEIGKSYRWLEEWTNAELWYDKYLEKDKNASPDEIIRYSEILAKNNHIKKGEVILKEYVDKYPDDWRLWSRYGYFTLWLGKYKVAEKAFETALEFKPFFKEAQDGLDQVRKEAYLTTNDPRSSEKEFAIDRYYRLLKSNPEDLDTRFKLIDELVKAKRFEEAYQQLQRVGLNNSADPRFQERYDTVFAQREAYYKSKIESNLSLIEKNPLDKKAVKELAQFYTYLENYESSLQVLENYFAQVPDEKEADIRFLYARVAAWARDFDHAIEIVDLLIADYPNNNDYKLFRAQLSLWNNRDLELADTYLQDVLSARPNNVQALIAKGSLSVKFEDYATAQQLADSVRALDPYSSDLVTLQTNIDFQKLRAEEERLYKILEEGRQFIIDGDCVAALPYYEEYLQQAEPNIMITKEYGDALFCAKEYDKALEQYNMALEGGYFYEAALQRAKLLYKRGDSLAAVVAFKGLVKEEPMEFEPRLYLADSYAKIEEYDSAAVIYDSLLTWQLDSTEIGMVVQRQEWLPAVGLKGILRTFPSGIGISPLFSFYTDNLSFRMTKLGARADVGVASFLTLGVSFTRTSLNAKVTSLDSATIDAHNSSSSVPYTGNRGFTTFKGHVFLKFSKMVSASVGTGVLNVEGGLKGTETEANLRVEKKDKFHVQGTYINSDAALILYSPYLIDLAPGNSRFGASLYKLDGSLRHSSGLIFSGYFQYVSVSDNNEGNDLQFRIGKYFDTNLVAGYEYFFSNYKYTNDNSPFYYSPEDFESHSVWADFEIEKSKTAEITLGGKAGMVPSSDFMMLEGHLNIAYKFSNKLTVSSNLSMGSTSRDNSSYRYFSGNLSAYWSL